MNLSKFIYLTLIFPVCGFAQFPDPYEAGWEGMQMCEIQHEDDINRILICTFPPGTGHEKHYHGPTFNYFLEGGLILVRDENGESTITLETGLNYFSEEVSWHEILNVGSTTVTALLVEIK